jgi:hypothetical protein
VNGRVSGVDLFYSLSARAFGYTNEQTGALITGFADLGNTAYIKITLSPGWTFSSSDSPTFLSESPFNVTAVPEPETYALLFAGLLAVGMASRRRERQLKAK